MVRCFGSELVAAAPPFLCFGGASERVVLELLAKCYDLGAGARPIEPQPPTEHAVSVVEGFSWRCGVFV